MGKYYSIILGSSRSTTVKLKEIKSEIISIKSEIKSIKSGTHAVTPYTVEIAMGNHSVLTTSLLAINEAGLSTTRASMKIFYVDHVILSKYVGAAIASASFPSALDVKVISNLIRIVIKILIPIPNVMVAVTILMMMR
jgi:hypothetical protein